MDRHIYFETQAALDALQKRDVLITVIGEGTTDPPAGLHPLRRFAEDDLASIQGCEAAMNKDGCTFTEVTVTATPAAGWMLRRWHGDVRDAAGDTVTVDLREPQSVIVEFVERPGLDTLDLSADFQAFLTSIGQGGAFETYDRYGWAWGDGEQVAAGNGIPDAAELLLLETVLKSVNLDLSIDSGVVRNPVWDAWQENLAYVAGAQPGTPITTQRVYAAFLTLGGASGQVLYEDLSGAPLPEAATVNLSRGRFLDADEDAGCLPGIPRQRKPTRKRKGRRAPRKTAPKHGHQYGHRLPPKRGKT